MAILRVGGALALAASLVSERPGLARRRGGQDETTKHSYARAILTGFFRAAVLVLRAEATALVLVGSRLWFAEVASGLAAPLLLLLLVWDWN